MKKSLIATGAASLALAAMPVVGVFAATPAQVQDTVKVIIDPSCTFEATKNGQTVAPEGTNPPDRKSTRLNSSHRLTSRMPSSA